MERARTTDDTTHPANTVSSSARRTVGLTAVLTAVPFAFVAAASYPVVATVVLTLTAGLGLTSRYQRRGSVLPLHEPDPGPEDYPSVPAATAPD